MPEYETRPGLAFSDRIEDFEPQSVLVRKAFEFALEAHAGVLRKDGSEFFSHCVAVAEIMRSWGINDQEAFAAALLHDVVEDTEIPLTKIEEIFGETVAKLVDGVTKLKSGGKSSEAETRRKIVEQGYFEPRVILIKLADRLHNMMTLSALPPEKQQSKALETLDVYAPLAESLGMWRIKTELEDLAFPFVDPDRYGQVKNEIDNDPRLSESVMANIESHLTELLFSSGFSGRVELRLKGYYEADKKRERMAKSGRGEGNLAGINDLISYRVVLADIQSNLKLDNPLACYAALGLIHQNFGDLVDMDRFDDFIVSPTANKYSALQTTVRSPQGPFEIAVMTQSQEDFNHWGIVSKIRAGETDLREYVQKVVFTPGMKTKFFSPLATGWDFAYRVNPLLGARAAYLEVNGERKPMSTILPNAAVIKVVLGNNLAPDKRELDFTSVKTRQQMEEQQRLASAQEAISLGHELLEPDLARLGLLELEDLAWMEGSVAGSLTQPLAALLVECGCSSLDGLYSQLGHQRLKPAEVIRALENLGITKAKLGWSSIGVVGQDQPGILAELTNMLHEMDKNIVGIQTRTVRGRFNSRVVTSNLTVKDQQFIRNKLTADPRFEQVVVV